MYHEKRSFLFVLYPTTLTIKSNYVCPRLSEYSVCIYRASIKEDEVTIIPIRQQKISQNCFILNQGKLQFTEESVSDIWQTRKVVVYDQGRQIGWMEMNLEEYVANYMDYGTKSYTETVHLTDDILFQFQLFLGTSSQEVSELLIEFKGESTLKTPFTRQSREEDFTIDNVLRNTVAQSQVYSPSISLLKINKEGSESGFESVITEPVIRKNIFSVTLQKVPIRNVSLQPQAPSDSELIRVLRSFLRLSLQDKLTFILFVALSVGMIYLSMLPIKRL